MSENHLLLKKLKYPSIKILKFTANKHKKEESVNVDEDDHLYCSPNVTMQRSVVASTRTVKYVMDI